MQMKKRVLSVLLALCLAGSLASTAWAAGDKATPETAEADTSAVVLNEEEEQQDETTASQEETSGEDSTAAPAEDPVAQVTETEADDGSVEYTAALETDGQTMNVVVTAPEGAFAEDVQPELSVTMLTAEDELNAVADKLDTAEVQYDGFTALDITFTDKATGEEIEPVQQVSVRIELPQTIVDSGIDLNTLAVQHLEEDADGNVQNVTEVATLDNGITLSEEAAAAANEAAGVAPMSDLPAEEATAGDAAETPAAVAEFEVDGFSSFVITWNNGRNLGYVEYFNIEVHYVDEDGNPLSGKQSETIELNDGSNIEFANYAGQIAGYTYQAAHYQSIDGDVITRMEAKNGDHGFSHTITFYDGNRKVYTEHNTWSLGGENDTKERDIYLVYSKDESTDPGTGGDQGDTGTVTQNATVTTSKTAVLKTDNSGNYDLTLSISGDRGNKTKKQAVDVLFIVDRSGSMTTTRQNALDSAVETLITTLQSDRYKDNIDARYGVVAFAGSKEYVSSGWGSSYHDYGTESYNWTNDGNATLRWIRNLDFEGGTNYQQAIYTGKEMLNNRDADRKANAITFVIFISDGIPTYRGVDVTNKSGDDKYGNGSNDNDGKNIAAAVTEIRTMTCDYFYAIGMGDDFGQEWSYGQLVDKQGTTNLKKLANAVNADYAGDENVYSADDEDLSDAFGNITATITFFAATDVTITDPLSEYADLVLTNEAPQFTITVTREASDDVKADFWSGTVGPNETVTFYNAKGEVKQATARVSEDNRTIYMDLPVGYELEPGYTYSISTVITPSQEALTAGMNSDAAKQTPDAGTGTHADANQQGFWSNINDDPNTEAVEGAQVTFTANGEDGSQAFPKPVIQVPEKTTVDLTLEKTFVGLTDAEVNYLIFLRDDGFGWDINYCQPELREGTEKKDGKETTYATYMADEDAVKGITLPDGTAVTGGGDFRITAKQFLSKSGEGESGLNNIDGIGNQTSGYTNSITGASLKKVGDNWVYSVTLQVPKAEGGYFYTVFEQHGEVPGYAKLDDSNVVYTVTGIEGLTGGTGKFIDNADKNVYVDMDTEVDSVDVTVNGNNYTIDGEEAAINQGVLQKLEIADDTTIAFENNYTGNLKVSKTVSGISDEDLTSAALANKAFTITLQPSENIVNLELLDGRTINYTITNNGTMTTGSAVMDKDDNCAIQVDLKYGDTITFQEIPAIQYTVTENAPATTGGYDFGSYTWIGAEYSETSENFGYHQTTKDHWNHNGLSGEDRHSYDTIGTDEAGDCILSVDSKIGDSRPVQTLQIINKYVEYKSLTIEKDITGTLAIPTDQFTFTITGATGITAENITKSDDDITVTVANGTITAILGKGDSITINKLTDDHTLTISEDSGDYTPIIDLTGVDGYVEGNPDKNTESQHSGFTVSGNQVTVEVKSVTDESDNGTSLGTVKYNNQKNVTPPTGLESNHTTPYTLMVTAAGIAGLALIGGIVVRRRRRRME